MIDSRAERWRQITAILIFLSAVSGPEKFAHAEHSATKNRWLAQVGPPVRLKPPLHRKRSKPPAKSEPAAKILRPIQSPAREPNSVRKGLVEVDTLDIVDPDSVGLLDPSHGGFGANLWKGTKKTLVERLLPKLATTT